MSRLKTTFAILRYSFLIMGRNPRLLAFPAMNAIAMALVMTFLYFPILFNIPVGQVWQAIYSEEARAAIGHAFMNASEADAGPLRSDRLVSYTISTLIAMLVINFINVAFYSQIMEVMSGSLTSVAHGFRLAFGKMRAIIAWSTLVTAIMVLLEAADEGSGILAGISQLASLTWQAASLFVIPIIINEPRTRQSLDYLKISLALLKRVWAEGLIGFALMALVAVALMIALTAINFALMTKGLSPAHSSVPVGLLTSLGVFALLYMAFQMFLCGLYVYATQGVPPGAFNDETFERTWSVRDPQQEPAPVDELAAVQRARRSTIWLAIPAAVLGIPTLWAVVTLFRPAPPPLPVIPTIGHIRINLAELEYSLGLEDLQAADLFAGKTCAKCDFSAKGTWVKMGSKRDSGLHTWVGRQRDLLYISVNGTDTTTGQELLSHVIEVLQSRFPGHEAAIGPVDDIPYVPRTTVASWTTQPGAASYIVEVDCFHCCGDNRWCTDIGSKWKIERNIRTTTYSFDWVGAQPGRWRVWSMDANGRQGPKSDWTNFDYSM
jgi:hypothetical protein